MPKKIIINGHEATVDDDSRMVVAEVRGFKLVEFIGHALFQMKTRDITEEEVLLVMRQPDVTTGLDTEPGRFRFRRNKTARIAIDVVFEEGTDRIRVVTAIKIERRMTRRGNR